VVSALGPADAVLVTLLTGLAALVVLTGAVLLAIRSVRSRERRAAAQEIEQLSSLLDHERNLRLACELRAHNAEVLLTRNGIAVEPHPEHDVQAIEPPDVPY